jgi:hypothetical protein
MQITHHLDYENIVCGRSEVVHLVILFKAAKLASDRSSAFTYGLVLDTTDVAVLPFAVAAIGCSRIFHRAHAVRRRTGQ